MPNTKTSSRTRRLFLWMNQVKADPELSPVAFMVAYEIGQHFNSKHGGAAWPSSLTIATNIGVDKATVIRAVRQLRERGHLKVDPGKAGRGHSNRYRMAKPKIKGAAAHLSEPIKGASGPRKGAPAHLNHLEPSMGTLTASPKGERYGSRALTDPGALRLEGSAPKEEFDKLWSLWSSHRNFPDTDDDEARGREAYVAIVPGEVSPGELHSHAEAHIAGVKANSLKVGDLWKWLARNNWRKDPPPPKPKRGQREPSPGDFIRNRYGGGS
jgi:hypothetical protein